MKLGTFKIKLTVNTINNLLEIWNKYEISNEYKKNYTKEYIAQSLLKEIGFIKRGNFHGYNEEISRVIKTYEDTFNDNLYPLMLSGIEHLDVKAYEDLLAYYLTFVDKQYNDININDDEIEESIEENAKQVLKYRDNIGLIMNELEHYLDNSSDNINIKYIFESKLNELKRIDDILYNNINYFYVTYDFVEKYIKDSNIPYDNKWWWWYDILKYTEEQDYELLLSITKSEADIIDQLEIDYNDINLISEFINSTINKDDYIRLMENISKSKTVRRLLADILNYYKNKPLHQMDDDINEKLMQLKNYVLDRYPEQFTVQPEYQYVRVQEKLAASSYQYTKLKPGIYCLFYNKNTKKGEFARVNVKINYSQYKRNENVLIDDKIADPQLIVALRKIQNKALKNAGIANTEYHTVEYDIESLKYLEGGSIQLAAYLAILYASGYIDVNNRIIACTGMIDISGNIQSVDHIEAKVKAALEDKFNLIFVPNDNLKQINSINDSRIKCVNNVDEVISIIKGVILSEKNVGLEEERALKCAINLKEILKSKELHVGEITDLQNCKRITVAGLGEKKPIMVDVFYGKKGISINVKGSTKSALYVKVKNIVERQTEQLKSEMKNVENKRFNYSINVVDEESRNKIKEYISKVFGEYIRTIPEENCVYRYDIYTENETIIIKQYNNGNLYIEGDHGKIWEGIKGFIENKLGIIIKEKFISQVNTNATISTENNFIDVNKTFPIIGIDESGKGDYFGPLVAAGLWIDEQLANKLHALGVKDSKKLSDSQVVSLSEEIKRICSNLFNIVKINPAKYNDLYNNPGINKNLNKLLAWGHARVLENILKNRSANIALSDQFGDEHFIKNALMEKGKKIELRQMPKAEQNIAVAAASILARAEFLNSLERFSSEYKINIPKGASQKVIDVANQLIKMYGYEVLKNVAKLHFKTTTKLKST